MLDLGLERGQLGGKVLNLGLELGLVLVFLLEGSLLGLIGIESVLELANLLVVVLDFNFGDLHCSLHLLALSLSFIVLLCKASLLHD